MNRYLVSMLDIEKELPEIVDYGIEIKKEWKNGNAKEYLRNKSLGMIFEKPSTRTRVSFEVAMTQLGGHALYLSPKDLQIGRGETIGDTAKVLSRFVDGIMYRAFSSSMMKELAENATVPVINGLDDKEHPCQIVADLMTIKEHKGELKGLNFTYIGESNNVSNSLMLGCAIMGMNVTICSPEGYTPEQYFIEKAEELHSIYGGSLRIVTDPVEGVREADVVYTDVWVSMGDETPEAIKKKQFEGFQVNMKLMSHARNDAIIMHCLPAHRGVEIDDEAVDSKQSVVFDEAENRLHAQKAILIKYMKGGL